MAGTTMTNDHRRGEERGIVDLLAAGHDVREVGGKAAPLARASASGLRVPAGFVVTASADASAVSLRSWLAAAGGERWAVRSSAAGEDASERSYAGQLESLLDVTSEDVPRAIERCRRSARALRVLRYAGSPGDVAVVVQRMVKAERAGVAFSADPSSGERGVVVIEAVRGLSDRLLHGERAGERWRVSGGASERVHALEERVLSDAQAAEIAAIAARLEQLFGRPQDVEWAIEDGVIWVLQSRPITALPASPIPIESETPEGSWERDDHHGVLSPLGWRWLAPYPVAMADAMKGVLPVKEMRAARVKGHLYLHMVMEGGDGPAPPAWVLWLVTRLLPSMRRADRACAELLDRETYVATMEAWEREGRAAMARATDALFDAEPHALSDRALLDRIDRALTHSARGLAQHAALGGPNLFAIGKLAFFLGDELGWDPNRVFTLLAGSSPQTTELHRSLSDIADAIARELGDDTTFPATWGALATRAPAASAQLADWLERHRLRMTHYEPKHPMLGETPDVVLSVLASIVATRGQPMSTEARDRAEAVLEEARAKLEPARFAELERLLDVARRAYALRDENGIETVSRPSGLLRWYVLELGRRLGLESPAHAVYLEVDEHGPALRGEIDDLSARIERRRGEESWALRHRGPRLLGKAPDMPPVAPFPRGLRNVMRIFAWMMKAETPGRGVEGETLHGVGIGERVVRARVRVIDRPEDLASLRHGEVLVCRITSPEWSVALARVAAIVTNEGALLSHPAIIAREYGVTAVVGCGPATTHLTTGDRVCVDPLAGTVTRLAR